MIHRQERDKNHRWKGYHGGQYISQHCERPEKKKSHYIFVENTRESSGFALNSVIRLATRHFSLAAGRYVQLHSVSSFTLFASFLFSLFAIASRKSTPKYHGLILTVSFISATTNILAEFDRPFTRLTKSTGR